MSGLGAPALLQTTTQTIAGTVTANQGTANATPWNMNVAQVGGATISQGQKAMANSFPVVIASDQASFPVTIAAGSAVIGHVITDSGSVTNATLSAETTKVIGTVNQGTSPWVANATLQTQTDTVMVGGVNIKEINAVTPLMGNGVTGTGSLRVTIASDNTAFPVNATLSAETTKVIGTVNQGTSPWVANATLQTQTDTVMVGGVNIKEINAVTPLMGNGVTGTGSLRVTIASDNTAFAVNATLSAETTKVIGVVRSSDGAGNLLTSNSTTYSSKFALDSNLLGTLGTAFTTPGKVDVKGADGDVFVRQTTASNLNATVVGTGTFAVQAALNAETTKVIGTVNQGTSPWVANATLQTQTDTVMVGGVNIKEINAVAPLMGNGVTGTGSQRVTVASDNTGIANWGHGATGAAVPAGATYYGVNPQTALPTAATAGNLTGVTSDKFGRIVTLPQGFRDLILPMTQLTLTATTTETTLIAAVASTFLDIISLVVINTSSTGTQVDFRDSTTGTVRLSLYVPGTDTRGVSFTVPLPQNAVNNNWTAKSLTSVSSIIITGSYILNR